MVLKRLRNRDGQYMVEFALALSVFVFFVFFVIDLGLLIYIHNTFYHGVARGARVAALGGSNDEIQDAVEKEAGSYLSTIFLIARPEQISVTPEEEINRVDGTEVLVKMDTTIGISLFGVSQLVVTKPVRSRMVVVQQNDADRDGCKDDLSGAGVACDSYDSFPETFQRDHRNTGSEDAYQFGGEDSDPDGDGIDWADDTVAIAYINNGICSGYYIYRPHNQPGSTDCGNIDGISGTVWESWFDGWYHAPEIWEDGTEAAPQLFERKLPRWHVDNSSLTYHVITLRTAYDSVNNGWEDKYDRTPQDPTTHGWENLY
ncbi:MAG: TadE/TadG family type IV pilus assembly protein [bacterium]